MMETLGSSAWYQDLAVSDLPDDEKREVVKSLTVLFGKVHQMSRGELVANLKENNLHTGGSRDVLVKRLKNHYRVQKLASVNIMPTVKLAPYYLVVDFEATCNTVNAPDYPHEIIEFPAVLVSSKDRAIIDTFQSYVRPEINPILSDFCVQLTGITQATVDASDTFEIVLRKFEEWMSHHGLHSSHKCILVTDGPWDMAQFFHGQCKVAGVQYPTWAKRWLNIRKAFRNYYKKKMHCNLKGMLETLGMEFEGRPHCGLDDAKNIARILLVLMDEHAPLHINERLTLKDYRNREKVLLSSATAIVQKRTNGMGDLLERLQKASLACTAPKPSSDCSGERSSSSQKGTDIREKEQVVEAEQEKRVSEDLTQEGSSDSDHNEDEVPILWNNNKFSALRKQEYV
ncbi:3'-5' exoribonuclease 1 [Frankliniella fusca]|uniref:3'-5' exoribonuclease 1 n=1 Tax=Frankliniella fusca TaxID=407009 RepID=A0AAE1H9Q7_9NEOP|nr:3'-5' exoribonuclease 1 [Frankliniella fusca]